MIIGAILECIVKNDEWAVTRKEVVDMAKEIIALRKSSSCQHQWNTLKLVECGGRYQYCTLCGAKKAAE